MSEFLALNNKYLIVMKSVILTPVLDYAIAKLDEYFEKFNAERYVTSGLRDPAHQLDVIIQYAKQHDIACDFTKDFADVKIGNSDNYIWQDVWSQLLVKGLIINPPHIACTLHDHKNSNGDVIPAGTVYQQSKHVTGNCFDMSSWRGNQTESEASNVDDEKKIIQVAKDLSPEIGILSYVVERANNCLHVNINPLVIK